MSAERREDRVLHRLLADTEESATVALFVQLCRESPALRRWLWQDFAQDEKTRTGFATLIKHRGDAAPSRVAELAETDRGRATELQHLKQQVSARIFGGRTWSEIEAIVAQLRAGRADLGTFLLALQWHRAGSEANASAMLQRAATALVDDMLRHGQRARLAQLASAAELVQVSSQPEARRSSVAFGDWWKLQVLLHILRHPRPSYRTRELHRHLATLGLNVDTREIRRFCTRHGISRDMRGGRPKLESGSRTGGTRKKAVRRRT